MKRYSWILIIIFILNGIATQAQDTTPPDDTTLLYYEDEYSRSLDHYLLSENICLEAVIRLNPNLDFNHVPYGTPIRIPVHQPCYMDENSTANGTWAYRDGSPKRLKYYEDGEWLAEPYYSDNVVYLDATTPDYIAQKYNVCVDDLLAQNILLLDFERYRDYVWFSMDVFIPSSSSPCPDTDVSTPTNVIVKQMTQAEITPTFFQKSTTSVLRKLICYPGRRHSFSQEQVKKKSQLLFRLMYSLVIRVVNASLITTLSASDVISRVIALSKFMFYRHA